jgi:hypothetical protein
LFSIREIEKDTSTGIRRSHQASALPPVRFINNPPAMLSNQFSTAVFSRSLRHRYVARKLALFFR